MLRKTVNYGALTIITAALIIGGYCYWLHQKIYPNTDDAYIQAHMIDVASQINGQVQNVYVHNQQKVTKNELLFTIDPKPFQIALQKAQANLQNTEQEVVATQNAVAAATSVVAQRQAELIEAQKKCRPHFTSGKKGLLRKIRWGSHPASIGCCQTSRECCTR